MDKETILNSINSDISAFVSDKFIDYISLKVKEEVEKEKTQFLEGLNVSQEDFPVFNEDNHEHFKGIKIVNDPDIPFQKELARKYELLDTDDEFIMSGIKIDYDSLDLTLESVSPTLTREYINSSEFFITNKGNIYNRNGHINCGCGHPQLFNYKIFEFIKKSYCCGPILISRYVPNGNPGGYKSTSFNLPTEEEIEKFLSKEFFSPYSSVDCFKSTGCKYGSRGCDVKHIKFKNIGTASIKTYGQTERFSDVGSIEDSIERFMKNDICKECCSGELLDTVNEDINPEILRNPPMFNNEYIEILTLLSKKDFTIPIYQFQTIYAKYHPRANENSLMELKIRKLSNLEKSVGDAVKVEKNTLEKELKNYREKLKYVLDSIFILHNEQKQLIDDKSTFRLITKEKLNKNIKICRDKCKIEEQKLNEKQDEITIEEQKLNEKKVEFNQTKKMHQEKLLKMAIDMNDLNDSLDDKLDISTDLFRLIGELKHMI